MNKKFEQGTYFLVYEDEFLSSDYNEVYQVFDKDGNHINEMSYQQEDYPLYEKLVEIFNKKYKADDFEQKTGLDGKQLIFDLDKNTIDNHTDCRSDVGITTGLIDAMISICRILKERDMTPIEVKEALKDFQSDEDLNFILSL